MKDKSVVWLQGSGSEQPDPMASLVSHSRAQSCEPQRSPQNHWRGQGVTKLGTRSWDLAASALDPRPSQCPPCASIPCSALMNLQLTLLRSLFPWFSSGFKSSARFYLLPEAGESLFLTHKTLGALFPPFLRHTLQGCTSEWSTGLKEGKVMEENEEPPLGRSCGHTPLLSVFSPLSLMLLLLNRTNLASTSCSPKEQTISVLKDDTTCADFVTAEPKSTISSEIWELQISIAESSNASSFQFHSKGGSVSAALSWRSTNIPKHPKMMVISTVPPISLQTQTLPTPDLCRLPLVCKIKHVHKRSQHQSLNLCSLELARGPFAAKL